jgi:pantetheine-phosphate adenylyltransferase
VSIALIPGSFDPITLGHLDIVERAARQFDEVVVAVMNNEHKTYLFSMERRLELAQIATRGMKNVRVLADAGMLVDLFDRIGATVIIKGVRNDVDLVYEEEMARANLARNPRAVTEFWQASSGLGDVSSTRVREAMERGASLVGLLPDALIAYLSDSATQ